MFSKVQKISLQFEIANSLIKKLFFHFNSYFNFHSARGYIFLLFISTCIVFTACQTESIEIPRNQQFGSLPETIQSPINNPLTPEKVELGRALFWDPILSGNKDVACATCHHPSNDYAERLDLSLGVGGKGLSENRHDGTLVERNSMTILNTAFNGIGVEGVYDANHSVMFWDNRNQSLEEQALEPILSFEEMRGNAFSLEVTMDSITNRLKKISAYRTLFGAAFGTETIDSNGVAKALAAFQRTLVANNSRFDQYARGNEEALSTLEVRGMLAFSEVGCDNCHNGLMFSDFELHAIGVPDNQKLEEIDEGAGSHDFRTGSLRNLVNTAPYMHNGVFETLEEVLEFYEDASGGDDISIPLSK